MKKNWKTIAISIPIAVLFIWLALKNVDFKELSKSFSQIQYGWIPLFVLFSVGSYWIRAERWILLLGEERPKARRSSFFAGTMFGYMMNYIIPRVGEVSRCVYVSKKDSIPTLSLIGTVVLERVIDTLMLLAMIVFLFMYVITEEKTIINLFGEDNAQLILNAGSSQTVFIIIGVVLIGVLSFWLFNKALKHLANKESVIGGFAQKVLGLFQIFIDGMTNIKRIHNWPYFIFLTVAMWVCYIMMTYVPFSMFVENNYHLGIMDGAIVMILAAIGVTLPSPGGIGTYHWFVKQTLFVLYAIPESDGLVFAFVTHTSMFILVLLMTPILIGINTYILKKRPIRNKEKELS